MPRTFHRGAYFNRKASLARSRSEENLCLSCGYDLRASRGLCPECGEKAIRRLDRARLKRFPARDQPPLFADAEFKAVLDEQLTAIVHETTEQQEASLLVRQLEFRHIAAHYVFSNLKGQPFLSLFRVYVREDQKALAQGIIRQFEPD